MLQCIVADRFMLQCIVGAPTVFSSSFISMDAKVPSSICRLPQQLLAQVLCHVEPAQRMHSCALVSAAWRNATALATSSISLSNNNDSSSKCSTKCRSLSTWLQQHAAAAPINSIAAVAGSWSPQVLQLPAEELKLLRKLDLSWYSIAPCAAAAAALTQSADGTQQVNTSVLPSALSALTHLVLRGCSMRLSTLPAFTQLQHLALQEGVNVGSSDLSALGDALPTMQRLTHLALGGVFAQDSVLAGVGQLPSLQVLLRYSNRTAASFAALPAALTKLDVQADDLQVSTPGVAQLTAMQWLELRTKQVDISVLNNMHRLQHLVLDVQRLQLAENQPRLAALAGLTALQHLALYVREAPGLNTPADVSALTASSHLTLLELQNGVVDGEHYGCLFPEDRRLLQLRTLHASMDLLSRFPCVDNMAKCCANLETLDLSADGEGFLEWDNEYPPIHPVYLLDDVTTFRRLVLNAAAHEFTVTTWNSLACLTSLESLRLTEGLVPWQGFGGVASLAACKQLTELTMEVGDDEHSTEFELFNKAPAGSPPDVWLRLPAAAIELALDHYDRAVDMDFDQHSALMGLARSAAGHAVCMQQEHQQLQQELVELRSHYQAQQQEQQQLQAEQQRQRQELDELRVVLAAIRPQLQTPQHSQQ